VTRSATRDELPKEGVSAIISTASAMGPTTRADAMEAAANPLNATLCTSKAGFVAWGTLLGARAEAPPKRMASDTITGENVVMMDN
jgi:hypothetical protein